MKIGGNKWFFGYYRVEGSRSWVLCLKAPKFGLMHLGHYLWWKPLIVFPSAFVTHVRLAFFTR